MAGMVGNIALAEQAPARRRAFATKPCRTGGGAPSGERGPSPRRSEVRTQTVHARRAAIDNALLRDGAATGLEVWVAVRRPELLPVVRNELQHRRNTNGA